MTDPDPIRPRKIAEDVQDRLLTLIQEGGLRPGDVLPSERELMARYQVGRPAIREAMQSLQQAGLIEIRHGGRPRVAEPSLDSLVGQMGLTMHHLLSHNAASMAHLKEARTALECELARIAARKRSASDIDDLTALLAEQEAHRDDPDRFLEIDGRFHRRIAAISHNPLFETLCHGIFSWLRVFHVEDVRKPGLEPLTLAEHRSILDALAAQDEAAAAQAMREHLERANALYRQSTDRAIRP